MDWDITYEVFETRPRQPPRRFAAGAATVDSTALVADLDGLIARSASAHGRDPSRVSLKWTRRGMSGGTWMAYP